MTEMPTEEGRPREGKGTTEKSGATKVTLKDKIMWRTNVIRKTSEEEKT